jgi:hypothetical protein
MQNNKLIKRILAYSAKKIKANPLPPYATLKPETSSDSPPAKSKVVRLVSAKLQTVHKTASWLLRDYSNYTLC